MRAPHSGVSRTSRALLVAVRGSRRPRSRARVLCTAVALALVAVVAACPAAPPPPEPPPAPPMPDGGTPLAPADVEPESPPDGGLVAAPLPYRPCQGLGCGQSCALCPPTSVDCASLPGEWRCDAEGACVRGDLVCP